MESKYKFMLLALITLILAACNDDFLEEKRDLTGTNEEVFQDPQRARAYVDYVYDLFLPQDGNAANLWDLATGNDDLMQTTDELPGETKWNQPWAQISPSQNHALEYIGRRMETSVRNTTWSRIRQINIFLNSVDEYGIEESVRNELKGQLYFWRGFQYYELLRFYGGVPIVLDAQNPIIGDGSNVEANQVSRSSSRETLDQAISDFDQAIALLPGKWPAEDWGRVTSGAAAAMKGRAMLLWASPQFNRNDDTDRWQMAYDANTQAKTILEENGFGLFREGDLDNGEAWGNMWFTEVDNPEAVLIYGFNDITTDQTQLNHGWEYVCRPREIGGGGSISPTKQMVDAFPMKDGKMPGESTNYDYDPNKFYKDRDPRFYKTFAYNGASWPYAEDSDFKMWTYRWNDEAGAQTPNNTTEDQGTNASGIYLRKMTDPDASSDEDFFQSGTDFMEIRFAEVLLNVAESAVGISNLGEAKQQIIAVRERAGVENLDGEYGLMGITDRDALFGAVMRERQVEFAYEGKRYDDLRRWLLFNDDFGTVSRLGLEPIDGIRRQGYFIVAKDGTGNNYVGGEDPFEGSDTDSAPIVEREPETYPEGITTEEEYLDFLYDNYFEVRVKDDLDPTDGDWKFNWYNEYYFFGFYEQLLNTAPYLEQTVGWGGSYDPLSN